jgi:hypothetical protein
MHGKCIVYFTKCKVNYTLKGNNLYYNLKIRPLADCQYCAFTHELVTFLKLTFKECDKRTVLMPSTLT